MEINLLALIGIALATMFFGYFFGLLEGRGQGYKRRQKEENQTDLQPAVPADRASLRNTNLLELSRGEDGLPSLHVDGQRIDGARIMPDQRRRLIELMVMLRPWVEPNSASGKKEPLTPLQDVRPVSIGAGTLSPATIGPQQPLPAPISMSLVAQINAILQARLAGTALADRGIRLTEALHGGAIVFIGTAQYDGVDKVPDPEVQAAIRGAITEWERTAPG